MAMRHYYNVDRDTIRHFWMTLGIDQNKFSIIDKMDYSVSDLYEISPINFYFVPFTNHTEIIHNEYINYLDTVCSFCDSMSNDYDKKRQRDYVEAYWGIVATATNLNMIPKDSDDYLLYFSRLDVVLATTMRQLNYLSIKELQNLYMLIKNGKAEEIFQLAGTRYGATGVFIYLGMHPNIDLADYEMFVGNTANTSYERLVDLFLNNIYKKTYYKVSEGVLPIDIFGFKRVSIPEINMEGFNYAGLLPPNEELLEKALAFNGNPFVRPSYKLCKELTEKNSIN